MKKVTEKLYVAPQLTADDIRHAKSKGIVGVVNNRPDGEEPGQPSAGDNAAVAHGEGLTYTHIPVVAGQVTEDKVRAFQQALTDADGPVLAHCKTGTRSATLYSIGEVLDGRMEKSAVPALGERLGLDLSGAVKWLDANGH